MARSLYLNTKLSSTKSGPNQVVHHTGGTSHRVEKLEHNQKHLLESLVALNEQLTQIGQKQEQVTATLTDWIHTITPYITNTDDSKEQVEHIKIDHQLKQIIQASKELQQTLQTLSTSKGPFVEIFHQLPPNYHVCTLYVRGTIIPVTRFLNMNKATEVAHFTDETEIIAIDCNQIDAVTWLQDEQPQSNK